MLVKQVSNSGGLSSRTAASKRAFEAELHAAEKAAEAKRLEPIRAIEAEMNKVYQETERLRIETVLTNREENSDCLRLFQYCERPTEQHAKYTQNDWRVVTTRGLMDFDMQFPLLKPNEPEVTEEEKALLIKYCITNALYLGDYQSFLTAFQNLVVHRVIRRTDAPVAVAQADGNSEPLETQPEPRHTDPRRQEQLDRAQHSREVGEEIFGADDSVWNQAMRSIRETSGTEGLNRDCQIALFKFMLANPSRYLQPFTLRSIRKAAQAYWDKQSIGQTAEEKAEDYENQVFGQLSADDAAKELGLPRTDSRNSIPVRRV